MSLRILLQSTARAVLRPSQVSVVSQRIPLTGSGFVRHLASEAAAVQPDLTVSVTDRAAARLIELTAKNAADPKRLLRLSVDNGRCGGFFYNFQRIEAPEEGDRIFEKNGAKFVIDEASLSLISGSTIDFHVHLGQSSFAVVQNPNADQSCGCGVSFTPKLTAFDAKP